MNTSKIVLLPAAHVDLNLSCVAHWHSHFTGSIGGIYETTSDLIVYSLQIPSLLLGHWYEIMALYYVKSNLTEISASRQDRRVLQKSKIIRIEFLSKWGMLQTSRYV